MLKEMLNAGDQKENQVNDDVGRSAFEFLKGSKSSKINSVWEFDKW